ncbi:transcriptional regulator [Streptomyces sp. PD-S100-1]|uniref:transcriptional regulator n=1 Tax=Streptomyces sp. PD-S100-1 TaxID=3394351 RepID=UPI0039BCDDF5
MTMDDPQGVTSHQHHPGEQGPAEAPATNGEDLAALLTRLLDQAPGKTQKDLAAAAGIKYVTLNAWMNRTRGTTRIESSVLWALIDAFRGWGVELTPRDFFNAVGRPVPGPTNEEREQRLLRLYRDLPEDKQRDLVRDAEMMVRISRAS